MDSTWVQQELSNVLGIKQEKMAELEALRQETFQKQSLIEDELEQLSLREFELRKQLREGRHLSLTVHSTPLYGSSIVQHGRQQDGNYGGFAGFTPPTSPDKPTRKKSMSDKQSEFPVDIQFVTRSQNGAYLKACGIVVYAKGIWYELRCYICGGNTITTVRTGSYINGTLGMRKHLAHCHDVKVADISETDGKGITPDDEVVRLCAIRQLSPMEIRALCHGLPGAVAIEKIRSKTTDKIEAKEVEEADTPVKLLGIVDGLPTIVRFSDGSMIELRCCLCGANCYGSASLRFYKGVEGFIAHLRNTHSQYYQDLEDPILTRNEWAIQMCTYRKLTQEEVERLKVEGAEGYKVKYFEDPDKLSKAQEPSEDVEMGTNGSGDGKAAVDAGDGSTGTMIGSSQTRRQSKRLRRSMPEHGSDVQTPDPSIPQDIDEVQTFEMPSFDIDQFDPFMLYCPCTISGHPCGGNCMGIKVCTLDTHDNQCATHDHVARPTCLSMVFSTNCAAYDNGYCFYGHDDIEARQALFRGHVCNQH